MFCENCGRYNPENAKFCAACGARLNLLPSYDMQNRIMPPDPPLQDFNDDNGIQRSAEIPAAPKVLTIINAVLTLVMILLPFLPWEVYDGEVINIITDFKYYGSWSIADYIYAGLLLSATAAAVVGAVRLLMRRRFAAVFTIGAAVLYISFFLSGVIAWMNYLTEQLFRHNVYYEYYTLTVVPFLVELTAIAVIVTAVIILTRENPQKRFLRGQPRSVTKKTRVLMNINAVLSFVIFTLVAVITAVGFTEMILYISLAKIDIDSLLLILLLFLLSFGVQAVSVIGSIRALMRIRSSAVMTLCASIVIIAFCFDSGLFSGVFYEGAYSLILLPIFLCLVGIIVTSLLIICKYAKEERIQVNSH